MSKMICRSVIRCKFNTCIIKFSKGFSSKSEAKSQVSAWPEEISKMSTLFVSGRYGANVYQIVKPVIDINYIADNLGNLKLSCDQRGIHLDLEDLLRLAREWLRVREEYLAICEKDTETVTELHRSSPIGCKDEFQVLQKIRDEHFEKIGIEKGKLHDIEDVVMPLFQKIPHILHPNTPLQFNVIDMCQEPSIHSVEVRSHTHIAKDLLHFTNCPSTSYFMTGKLAELDFAIQQYFIDRLNNCEFSPLACVDFCKSFIMEAVGHDPYLSIKIKEKGNREIGQKLHLAGGASFETFCAYLTNMNVNKSTLPMKYFSLGRRYNAANNGSNLQNLFSVVQSTTIHSLILSESSTYKTFDILLQLIQEWYSELSIPYRVVNICAKNLTVAESQRKQFELWSPALKDYVPVAYVSQHDDFVSKRLQITYGIQHIKEGHCHIVEGAFVNIPVLIGCIIENFQTKEYDFNIPNVLKEYLFVQE